MGPGCGTCHQSPLRCGGGLRRQLLRGGLTDACGNGSGPSGRADGALSGIPTDALAVLMAR
jgi:hypothetical protein